ncbi:hypothetical protein FRC11_010075 [Ceratobasidium sp. 423]|nr:hypothetical protein FRC11_010075 [Ceratobasidium sp. 423]
MNSTGTSQGEIPGIRVVPEPVTERPTDNVDESPSPDSSHEVIQRIGTRNTARANTHSNTSSQSEVDPELAGLDALEDGRPGERPAYPFTTLIRYAIKGSPNGRLLLEDIYKAIQTRYPYFTTAPSGWKAFLFAPELSQTYVIPDDLFRESATPANRTGERFLLDSQRLDASREAIARAHPEAQDSHRRSRYVTWYAQIYA